jgi:P-type Mg2+ transporter
MDTMSVSSVSSPWSVSADDVLGALQSSPKGLSKDEAKQRLKDGGLNEVSTERTVAGWKIFLRQYTSPLVLILIAASVISASLGERTETTIILLLVFFSGLLAFVQEYRSERALRLLRKKMTRRATVIRGGKAMRIDARHLVAGDVVELRLGFVVPADIRLFKIEDLEVDESVITGESMPVRKTVEALAEDRMLPQEQINMAFLGTHVTEGSGFGVVVRTGSGTEFGRTATLLTGKTEETDFQKGIRQFGGFLMRVTVGLALIVSVILGVLHGNWGESVLFALALAVGISPELLPVIVTINLSRGATAMSKKSVLVKRLISIEDLGNADVFCTDKTGTLTVGKIRAREAIGTDGKPSDLPLAYAAQCLDLTEHGHASTAIDEAIADAVKIGVVKPVLSSASREDIVSFDFNRRRMSCVLGTKGAPEKTMIVKGAVAEVLSQCTSLRTGEDGSKAHMTAHEHKRLMQLADKYADEGVRLIAVAQRPISEKRAYSPDDERDLELIGFVLISDAPKESAKASLQSLERLNVRIIILTGDNERVTKHIAEQIGFAVKGILTGDDLEHMSDAELQRSVETTNVFARITPEHKLKIINAFKANGHTVGFMGDGVNDTPALRAADVGISFDSAVDVAKEAASVIMLKKNLSVLADGIREGRRTFVNMRTYIYSTISSNFGNMLSVAGSALLLPFIPLLPAQILLLNFLSDAPMLSISADNVPDEELAKPKHWNISQISNFMYFFGIISSLADYATFAVLLFVTHANVALFRSGWFVESAVTEIVVIYLLRSKILSLKNLPGKALMVSGIATIAVCVLVVQLPIGKTFEFVPLSPQLFGFIAVIILGYGILTVLGKKAYYRFKASTM